MSRPRITTRQQSYFVALAETGQFTRAAERVGVSQPSLSQQVRALEETIGAFLVECGRMPVLTPVGRDVLERARSILLALHDLQDVRVAHGAGMMGTIRLGVSPTLGAHILPALVARLHREHPALRVHVREALPDMLAAGLAAGEHDIVLAQLPMQGRGFHVERLFREPLHLAMASDHPLHRTFAALSRLRGYIMALFERRVFARTVAEIIVRAVHAQNPVFADTKHGDLFNRYLDLTVIQMAVSSLVIGAFTIVLQSVVGLAITRFYHPFFFAFSVVLLLAVWLI